MRKPKIPALTKALHLKKPSITQVNSNDLEKTIVDGGGFLDAVVWKPLGVFGEVVQQYVSYVDRHYEANTLFVFKFTKRTFHER